MSNSLDPDETAHYDLCCSLKLFIMSLWRTGEKISKIRVVGGGGGWGGGGRVTRKIFGWGCAAGTLKTPPIHIISRLTKHTYSYNLHIKRVPIHTI